MRQYVYRGLSRRISNDFDLESRLNQYLPVRLMKPLMNRIRERQFNVGNQRLQFGENRVILRLFRIFRMGSGHEPERRRTYQRADWGKNRGLAWRVRMSERDVFRIRSALRWRLSDLLKTVLNHGRVKIRTTMRRERFHRLRLKLSDRTGSNFQMNTGRIRLNGEYERLE